MCFRQAGIRDRSLITGRGGGGLKMEGGGGQILGLQKKGGGVLAMLKGGTQKFCGSFNMGA